MTINPSESVGGCRLIHIRDFVKRNLHGEFNLRLLAASLKVTKVQATSILKWLHQHRYVKPVDSKRTSWRATNSAGSLANASARRKTTRATADRLLEGLLDRAGQVNRAREFAYYVARIRVWGSYLTAATKLGDLDVAVELRPAEENVGRQMQLKQKRLQAAAAAGRRLTTTIQRVYWPQEEVFRFLKAGKASLHFVPPDDGIFASSPQRVVFEGGQK